MLVFVLRCKFTKCAMLLNPESCC